LILLEVFYSLYIASFSEALLHYCGNKGFLDTILEDLTVTLPFSIRAR